MVNTFLTVNPTSSGYCYHQSAKNLDQQRLIKQIVEADQILRTIQNATIIANVFDLDFDVSDFVSPPTSATDIISKTLAYDHIYDFYRKSPEQIVVLQGTIYHVTSDDMRRYFSTKDTRVHSVDDDHVVFTRITKSERAKYPFESFTLDGSRKTFYRYPRRLTLLSNRGDRFVGCGFASHPAARAWVGYSKALLNYIQSHEHEVNLRMRRPTSPAPSGLVLHPWWSPSTTFINIHKAALLRKERTRSEPAWYETMQLFLAIDCSPWIESGYIWPIVAKSSRSASGSRTKASVRVRGLCEADISSFLSGVDLDVSLCSPITSDTRPRKPKAE